MEEHPRQLAYIGEEPGGGEPGGSAAAALTVSQLNQRARRVLEDGFAAPLWVEGELSNLARPASGHIYFTLKDGAAQVRCAMFRGRNRAPSAFTPQEGMMALARGQVSLYELRGSYQLIVDELQAAGAGALHLAFEALKRKLAAEGLFAEERKKPLPPFPSTVGIITSPSGAAIRDMLSVMRRRFPLARIILYPAAVQGREAAPALVRMLALADRRRECDLLLLARGGGSLEDLWAFNEEAVARAIHACRLPVVTGIGHEIDYTIADFVADQRAPTPSAAAEMVSPNQRQLLLDLAESRARLRELTTLRIEGGLRQLRGLWQRLRRPDIRPLQQRLDELSPRVDRAWRQATLGQRRLRLAEAGRRLQALSPLQYLRTQRQNCRWLAQRLRRGWQQVLEARRNRLRQHDRTLSAISPLRVLERGYAIVNRDPDGPVVNRAGALRPAERIRIRFHRGAAQCTVDKLHE